MIVFLEEINKPTSMSLEMDLGFSLLQFMSSYRKRFHTSKYDALSITMTYTAEELGLFESFYVETLEYGANQFQVDFGIGLGVATYNIVSEPSITHIANDMYYVSLSLLQYQKQAGEDCITTNTCLNGMLVNLTGLSTSISAKIIAPALKTDTALCLSNLSNLIFVDINKFEEKKVL